MSWLTDLWTNATTGWGEAVNELTATLGEGVEQTGVELMDWVTGRGSTATLNEALQATRETTGAIRTAGGARPYFETQQASMPGGMEAPMGEMDDTMAEQFANMSGVPAGGQMELTPLQQAADRTLNALLYEPEADGTHGTEMRHQEFEL